MAKGYSKQGGASRRAVPTKRGSESRSSRTRGDDSFVRTRLPCARESVTFASALFLGGSSNVVVFAGER